MMYIYSLYDAKTGELRHEGTPGELVKAGVFGQSEEASRTWTRQHLQGVQPGKWRVERRQKMPRKKRRPDTERGIQTRAVWEYRMFGGNGALVCEGTAQELVEQGFFDRQESAANTFYAGKNMQLGVCSVERKKGAAEDPVPALHAAERNGAEKRSTEKAGAKAEAAARGPCAGNTAAAGRT